MINVLVACEESQRVAKAFELMGANAFSCDIIECSGERPDIHILGDATKILTPKEYADFNGDIYHEIQFKTMDGKVHHIPKWDVLIAHPPCTYFSRAGARWYYIDDKINKERIAKMEEMRKLFLTFLNADIEHIAVENPIPMKKCNLPPHTQQIQPYEFGDKWTKATRLWLKNLPPLKPTNIVVPYPINFTQESTGSSKIRSKTFQGIANAMAYQWYDFISKEGETNEY